MKIYHNAFQAGRDHPSSIIALGKFDAMHLGHHRIIDTALDKARAFKTSCLVVTFDPTPELFCQLYSYQPVLSLAQRLEMLKALGVGAVVLLPFDKNLTCLSPEAFADTVLSRQLKPLGVCVGADFCFGKDRAGRVSTLEELGDTLGFTVYPVPLLNADGEKITATRIRRLLDEGEVAKAESLLGRKIDAVL
ncbi:MAG: adenylyltransferase/cytidyltransferase family protein [Elusimicrobiota bacterium]